MLSVGILLWTVRRNLLIRLKIKYVLFNKMLTVLLEHKRVGAKIVEISDVQNQGSSFLDGSNLRHLETEIYGLLHEEEQYWQWQA